MQSDQFEALGDPVVDRRPGAGSPRPQRFEHAVADPHPRIELGARVLQHDLHPAFDRSCTIVLRGRRGALKLDGTSLGLSRALACFRAHRPTVHDIESPEA
ncbi:hypothetical protein [Actinocatenispora comari]|uniref:hypothetical protein n=1 Tax=Actinocatenispora comari TaxID=2807577 RepID=UPI001A91D644|nr:hypothetical protein [Actinocatenispora comari]